MWLLIELPAPEGIRGPQFRRSLSDALTAVLGEPSYRSDARDLAASIASLPPMSHAAALLERLARERQPIEH